MTNPEGPMELRSVKVISEFDMIMDELGQAFNSGKTLSYKFRIKQLKMLKSLLQSCSQGIIEALHHDLRKPKMEALLEITAVESELSEAIRCLKSWMSPDVLPTNLLFPNDVAFVKPEPFGVVLILGAWNYPVMLTLQPLVGAIASGNCVIIKPSESAPYTASVISNAISKYLDQSCFRVIEGGVMDTILLLKQRFDYIFATCSTKIGKHVMQAAATNLTAVCLELGGKSPVYIHDSANLDISVRRILWGKLTNLGQTCVAPDYIICSKKVEDGFIKHAKSVLEEWYGSIEQMKQSSALGRIVNSNHFNRVRKLLLETKGTIVMGGDADAADLWITLTFVVNVEDSDILMEDEIFGPILPFVRANSYQDALEYLNSKKSKPLAIYLFSNDKTVNKMFLEQTRSGALSINEVIMHAGWKGLPFGGVQDSGMGSYHGKYSFDCFSHRKSVLNRDFSLLTEKCSAIRYPPYNNAELKMKFMSVILRNQHFFDIRLSVISHMLMFLVGLVVMFIGIKVTTDYVL